jgi:hypothetical protein
MPVPVHLPGGDSANFPRATLASVFGRFQTTTSNPPPEAASAVPERIMPEPEISTGRPPEARPTPAAARPEWSWWLNPLILPSGVVLPSVVVRRYS